MTLGLGWTLWVVCTACSPLEAYWDANIEPVSCHPQSYWLANNYIHIGTAFLVVLLPIPVVWGLQVRLRQKLLLLCLFAMGFGYVSFTFPS